MPESTRTTIHSIRLVLSSVFGTSLTGRFPSAFPVPPKVEKPLPDNVKLPSVLLFVSLPTYLYFICHHHRRVFIKHLKRKFQSTLPRGERHAWSVFWTEYPDFNPRSREGSDCNFHQKSACFSVDVNKFIFLPLNFSLYLISFFCNFFHMYIF